MEQQARAAHVVQPKGRADGDAPRLSRAEQCELQVGRALGARLCARLGGATARVEPRRLDVEQQQPLEVVAHTGRPDVHKNVLRSMSGIAQMAIRMAIRMAIKIAIRMAITPDPGAQPAAPSNLRRSA